MRRSEVQNWFRTILNHSGPGGNPRSKTQNPRRLWTLENGKMGGCPMGMRALVTNLKIKATGDHVEWVSVRDCIDLAPVATALMGPAAGRRGERGRRLWWSCPFHKDANPSFCIDPRKPYWRCFGSGEHGDAANLVMRLRGVTFPEAIRLLADQTGLVASAPIRPTVQGPGPSPQNPRHSGPGPERHRSSPPIRR